MSSDSPNPYETPAVAAESPARLGHAEGKPVVLLMWTIVFGLNMAVPLAFGWSMMDGRAQMGMLAAAIVLFTAGLVFCGVYSAWARPIIWGAMLLGLTQFVPIVHIVAGTLGLSVYEMLSGGNAMADDIHGELGGFVVTFVTGSLLIAASAVVGLGMRVITPRNWWNSERA